MKKLFLSESLCEKDSEIKSICRIMKLTTSFLLLCSCFAFANHANSQNAKVNLNKHDAQLEELLDDIENQTEYLFLSNRNIDLSQKVTIRAKNKSVQDVLETILKNTGLTFTVEGVNIILSENNKPEANAKQQHTKKVTGTVVDQHGVPVIGANIVEKGTTNGTVTDVNGNFALKVDDDAELQVSFIGYNSLIIAVKNKSVLNIRLTEDSESLDEVVVVGYGTMKKSDLTGSLSSVKSKDLTIIPANSPARALAGRAAGVYVLPKTGAPGGEVNIRIRGTNSIMGDNEPLYVVDGFPYGGNPSSINNEDIESIEILKDASATAIYGSRGANGVVMITTKKGKSGATKVEYTGSFTQNSIRKKLDLLDASEYATMINMMYENDGGKPYFDNPASLGKGTDWQDFIFQNAPLWNNNVSITGGSDKTQFSVGFGAYNENGIIKHSQYKRYSVRANLNHQINKYVDMAFSTHYSRINKNNKDYGGVGRGGSLISGTIGAPPTLTPYQEDGTITVLRGAYPFIADGGINPLNYIDEQKDEAGSDQLLVNAALTIKPMQGLTIRLSGGLTSGNERADSYVTKKFYNSSGSAAVVSSTNQSILSENIITYNKSFNKIHDLTVMGGFTYQTNTGKSVSASGSGFVSDVTETYDLSSAAVSGIPYSAYAKWSLLSYLGRVNYTLMNKYMFTASFRSDGSSRYSEGNKWGHFPSGAIAWRVKEEEFMKGVDVISDFKLRASFGMSGNTAISPYQTMNMLYASKVIFGKSVSTAFAPLNRLPSSLKWETTAQYDIGLDFGLFNNRLHLTADYYNKKTKDLLNSVQIPSSTGYTNSIRNVGSIRNQGVEFSVDGVVLQGDFNWILSANIAINRNKVLKLNNGEAIRGTTRNLTVLNDFVNILKEGEPLGIFYGYKENGYDENGKIVFQDLDGEPGLSFADKQKIGDPNPDFIGGLNSTMRYKGFELNLFFYGSFGNDVFNMSKASVNMDYLVGLNKTKDILYDSWTPTNTNAKNPRLSINNPINVSDRFVEDGSFLKLKNIQLGYHIPWDKLGIKWINSGQVYVSGQNLLTFTKYSWYDPEVNSFGGGASIDQGIDYLTYPTSKSVTVGVKLEF